MDRYTHVPLAEQAVKAIIQRHLRLAQPLLFGLCLLSHHFTLLRRAQYARFDGAHVGTYVLAHGRNLFKGC